MVCGREGVSLQAQVYVRSAVTQCRATAIQRFLGNKKLSGTMIYARAHDQTVAEDYFAAMQRVEERPNIVPESKQDTEVEVVKMQAPTKLFQLVQQLELPLLCLEERLSIVRQLHASYR